MTKPMKIVADDKIPFLRGVFEPWCEVVYLPGRAIAPADVADADALIVRTRTRCGRELLGGSRVRFVATATIGFDHIDDGALRELGIRWSSAPGCNADSVAQYVAAVLLGFGIPLAGRTLGVVGVGHVGSRIVKVGEALGMRVLQNDPPRAEAEGDKNFVPLETIRCEADVISLHVPKETGGAHPTVNLIDGEFFAGLRPGARLISAARGEVVDEAALKAALRSGQLADAAVDVWQNEPEIDRELLAMARFATPHIAGYSTDGKANGTTAAVRFIAAGLGIGELQKWRAVPPPPADGEAIGIPPGTSEQETLRIAVAHTFDLDGASRALKSDPGAFEALRGSAPLRREAPAYRVSGAAEAAQKKLEGLGFRLLRG